MLPFLLFCYVIIQTLKIYVAIDNTKNEACLIIYTWRVSQELLRFLLTHFWSRSFILIFCDSLPWHLWLLLCLFSAPSGYDTDLLCPNTAKPPCSLNEFLQDFKGTVGVFKIQNPSHELKAEKQVTISSGERSSGELIRVGQRGTSGGPKGLEKSEYFTFCPW